VRDTADGHRSRALRDRVGAHRCRRPAARRGCA
jgi:hypothetical protein